METTTTFESWLGLPSDRRPSPSGPGYWCPTHNEDCFRSCSARRNGRYGSAGVLFFHRASMSFLLNLRSGMINNGGTWSTHGGALEKGETALEGALREANEEIGFEADEVEVIVEHRATTFGPESSWSYTTVVVEVTDRFAAEVTDEFESDGVGWFSIAEMASLPLHPGFRKSVVSILGSLYRAGALSA